MTMTLNILYVFSISQFYNINYYYYILLSYITFSLKKNQRAKSLVSQLNYMTTLHVNSFLIVLVFVGSLWISIVLNCSIVVCTDLILQGNDDAEMSDPPSLFLNKDVLWNNDF